MSRYDAFISYRHSDLDKDIAASLHRALESYRVPRSLCRKGVPRKLHKVFRDEDELVAGDLPPRLLEALENTRYLIVICSPRTPLSKWVSEEVTHFQNLGRDDKILPVLVEGEPKESYPKPIRDADLLAADIRPPTRWRPRLRTEKLRLLARLLECDFDELYLRHRRRFIRTFTAAVCFGLLFVGVLGLVSYRADVQTARADALQEIEDVRATLQAKINEAQRTGSGQLPNPELIVLAVNLRKKVEEFKANFGPQTFSEPDDWIIRNTEAAIANANHDHVKALNLVTEDDERQKTADLVKALETRATAFYGLHEWRDALDRYRRILSLRPDRIYVKAGVADCYGNLGRLNEAFSMYNEIVGHFSRPVEEEGIELEDDLAWSHDNRGTILGQQGKLDAAIQDHQKAIEIYTRLVQQEGRSELEDDLALSHDGRGTALGQQGKLDAAIRDFEKAIEIYTRLVQREGRSELEDDLALSHDNRGMALADQWKLDEAIQDHQKAIEIRTQLVEQEARSELANYLAMSHGNRGNALYQQGNPDAAILDYEKAIEIFTRLVQQEGRRELANDLAGSHNNRGVALGQQGKLDAAISDFEKAIEIYNRLVQQEGRSELANDLAGSHDNRGLALREQGKLDEAIMSFEKAIEIYNRLIQQEGRSELVDYLAGSLNDAAWIYATAPDDALRDGEKAKEYALKACNLNRWQVFATVDTLAAAYAESKEFDAAVEAQSKAVELAPEEAKEELRSRLELYKSGKPYRQSPQVGVADKLHRRIT